MELDRAKVVAQPLQGLITQVGAPLIGELVGVFSLTGSGQGGVASGVVAKPFVKVVGECRASGAAGL